MKRHKKSQESGQTMIEYIILTSLIAIICIGGFKILGDRLKTRIKHINDTIEEKLQV